MSVSKDISLRVLASMAEFRNELGKMPGITETEARKASLAMQRELTKAEAAAAKSAAKTASVTSSSVKKVQADLGRLGQGAGTTESVIRALGGAIGKINPQLETFAQYGAEGAGAVEAVTRGGLALAGPLAAITVAVGAGAMAWQHYSNELKEAEEWTRKQAAAADEAVRAHDALADLQIDIAVMYGDMTEAEADLLRARERSASRTRPMIDLHQQEIDKLEAKNLELRNSEQVYNQHRGAIEANERAIKTHRDAIENLNIMTEEGAHALARHGNGTRDSATSARSATTEIDALATAMEQVAAAVQAEDNPFAGIETEVQALGRLREQYELTAEQMAIVDQRLAQLAQNRADVEADILKQKEAEAKKVADDLKAAQDRYKAEQQRAADEDLALRQRNNDAALQGIGDLTGATRDLFALQARNENATAAQREKAFKAAKAAALVEIAINTAVAITKALAQLGPIAGGAAAAGIAGTSAAQAAIVASQKMPEFHTGGSIDSRPLAPDERTVRVTKQEVVQTIPQAQKSMGQPIYVINQIGHRAYNSEIRDGIKSGAVDIRRGPVGHRSRSYARG